MVWSGPFKLNEEAPEDLYGKPGLYAILHDSRVVYIGKAHSAVFPEARNRENKWIGCLKKERIIPETLPSNLAYEYVWLHCQLYVGMVSDLRQKTFLDNAEKLLVFRLKPKCNKHYKKYVGWKSFLIENNGNRPASLPAMVQSPDL